MNKIKKSNWLYKSNYEENIKNKSIQDLKMEVINLEKTFANLKNNLPDNGLKLKNKILK